ncbi:MAG: hypothetical protein E6R07_13195 [Nevskiaceae bacterium]|nr:MAG: hypothetical protein E6R07_13195 [Nevskiaceae bacterium]
MRHARSAAIVSALLLSIPLSVMARSHAKAAEPVAVAGVVAVPDHYAGDCPAALEFTATVRIAKPPVTLEYVWERSNGSRTQVRRIQARSGTQKITDEWAIGGAPGTLKVWEKLTLLSPLNLSSGVAKATVECR